jgi:hypothetical protein
MVQKKSDEEAASAAGPFESTEESVEVGETTQTTLEELDDDSSIAPTPRFMQDERMSRGLRWIPPSIQRIGRKTKNWAKGPQPPRIQSINPIFPSIQGAPLRLIDIISPKKPARVALLIFFYIAWALTFGLTLRAGTFASEIGEYGEPVAIGCGATFWYPGNGCGINGNDCRPFNGTGFAFRCPASCASYRVLNPRAVGKQEIVYSPFVIGGPPQNDPQGQAVYRGDSFICQAAIHSGLLANADGGCGVVTTIGAARNYPSSTSNGIASIGFDSHFPLSYIFVPGLQCSAKDLRWPLLGISLTYTILLSLFTTSPAVFTFSIFIGLYFHVGFASDPPGHTTLAGLFSTLISRFLPSMFILFVLYRYCMRRTLQNLHAQFEKTILWLGGAWVGALTNYTFDFIPIQRLTPHDLDQQPGAKAALALIVIVLFFIVVSQVYYFRLEDRLIRYLGLYGLFVLGIVICVALPGLNLRIHHYILALLLLPGTSMQTRPALLYQGILLGLFINGIARWGFDSVLQTDGDLQGDAQTGSDLPALLEPIIALGVLASNITFSWASPLAPYDGVSILVNDVERYRGFLGDEQETGAGVRFVWQRDGVARDPEYFRFGFMAGSNSFDYTKAGTWTRDGTWTQMEAGPSKVRRRGFQEDVVVGEGMLIGR